MACGLLFEQESYAIRGAVFEVYKEMGCGFLEAVYQECLEREMRMRGIPFVAQPELEISYKGQPLRLAYRPDLVCFGSVIVEIKALTSTGNEHVAQVLNYPRATKMRLGLLVNFGCQPEAVVKRVVL